MEGVLNQKEIDQLVELGHKIKMSLNCDINDTGIPCRTDRLAAVNDMIEYIKIHAYPVGEQYDI